MGYQEKEQKVFQGLYDTRVGAAAPGWAAEDVVNIDFRRQSIRGRGPTSRVWTDALPSQGTYHDGQKSVARTTYAANAFCLDDLSSLANTGFVVRAYISGVNLARLQEEKVYSSSVFWAICGSTGKSTSQVLSDGWLISLEQYAAGDFRFRLDVMLEDTGTAATSAGSILVNLPTLEETDTVCIEWRWDPAHSTHKLSYFTNGSDSATATTSSALSAKKVHRDATATYYLTAGAFEYPSNRENLLYNFDGTIGQVEIHKIDTTDTEAETRWLSYPEGDIPTRVYFLSQPRGTDYTWGSLGNSSYTNSAAGTVELFPRSAYVESNEIVMTPGNTGYITALNSSLEGVKIWGWILGVTVNAPPAGDTAFTFPPWIITDEDNNFVVTVAAGSTPATNFKLNISVVMFDNRANPEARAAALSVQTSDIAFGTATRIAFFLQSTPEAYGSAAPGAAASTLRVFSKSGATWAQDGTDQTSVYVHGVASLDSNLGGYDGDTRTIYHQLTDVRGYSGLETFPSNDAEVKAVDVAPGGNVYPNGLLVSLDGTNEVATTSVSGKNAVQRWRDSRSDYVYALFPDVQGRRWFGGIGSMTGPLHSPILGVHDFNIQAGMEQTIQTAVVLPGGVYIRNLTTGTGQFYPAPMYGITGATSVVQYNDRLIVSGNGMRPFKVYPGGADSVGLQRPLVGLLSEVSADDGGELLPSTSYTYRFSYYNSLTGDESNLNPTGEVGTTSSGHDTLKLNIGILSKTNSDWDFLMVYRQAQGSNTYYLEQRVPRPTYWMNSLTAAVMVVTSQMRETELLLQLTDSIDNHPPGDFSTSAIGGRVMHFGGAGTNPGYVYYSKVLLPQSAPPTNVWQLNNDNSDRVMVIRPLFGRVIVLKQRSIWTARDDAAASGEQPANVHIGKGCVSPRAAAAAGNSLFFLSPDRVVYVTDGFEVSDVSSQSILGTLEVLTQAQLEGAQMTHDAPDQRIWLSIPPTGEGSRNQVLTFDYRLGRWSKWEVPHDVIDSGQDSSGGGQQRPILGSRGSVYSLGTSNINQESDAGAGQTDFSNTYAAAEYLLVGSKCAGFSSTFSWNTSVIGMPALVVFHSSSTSTETTDPIWDGTRLYTYIRGVTTSGSNTKIQLGHSFSTSGTHATLLVGTQFRRYLNHWFSPQGVGFDYLFAGWTFVPDQGVVAADNDSVFRVWFDDESTPTYSRGASEYALSSLVPDLSYSMRRRGRRLRYEILEGRTRGKSMEYQRAIIRYRIRGPRRRK